VNLGLTGGIATGKSLVCSYFAKLGAAVVDADAVYHDLLSSKALLTHLEEAFGKQFFRADGSLDRKSFGAHVFSAPKELERLNALTHPIIWEAVQERVSTILSAAQPPSLVVIAAPLLFEAGWENSFDATLVVTASEEQQVDRLKQRSHLSRSEALRRIRSQLPLKEKVIRADFHLENTGGLVECEAAVRVIFEKLVGSSS